MSKLSTPKSKCHTQQTKGLTWSTRSLCFLAHRIINDSFLDEGLHPNSTLTFSSAWAYREGLELVRTAKRIFVGGKGCFIHGGGTGVCWCWYASLTISRVRLNSSCLKILALPSSSSSELSSFWLWKKRYSGCTY